MPFFIVLHRQFAFVNLTKMSSKNRPAHLAFEVWVQLIPLLGMFTMLWITAWRPLDLSFDTIKFWEYLAYGWVYAAAVYLAGLVIFNKFLRAWWLAVGFAWFYFLLYAVNAAFLHHTSFMMSPFFWGMANLTHGTAFIKAYFTKWVVCLIVAFVLNGLLAAWLIRRQRKTLAQSQSRWLILLAVVLWAAPILRDQGLFHPTGLPPPLFTRKLREPGARINHSHSGRSRKTRW